MAVLVFQQEVLRFACSAPSERLTEAQLCAELGDENGAWFWDRLWDGKRATKLQEDLLTLIRYVGQHQADGKAIVQAFQHDVNFHLHLDDAAFKFDFGMTLSPPARRAVSPLMQHFYQRLSDSSFPAHVNGGTAELDRKRFIDTFWKANPALYVCPACDGQRPDATGGQVHADLDHFLPKSKYPFLVVHPDNLLHVCKDCNLTFKGEDDPLDDPDDPDDAPLVNTFHSYSRPQSPCASA